MIGFFIHESMITNRKLNITYILEHITQEDLMAKYTGIIVNQHTLASVSFRNPFRADKNPTCNFYYTDNNKLRLRDWAGPKRSNLYDADVFDCAGLYYNLNTRIPQQFNMILHLIARDFNIHNYSKQTENVYKYRKVLESKYKEQLKINNAPTVFKVIPRDYNNLDLEYWKQFNINLELLNKGYVYAVKEIYKTNKDGTISRVYKYTSSNPCYGYYNGKNIDKIGIWKLYFPFAKKPYPKFMQNIPTYFGKHLVNCNRIGVITKSYKDALTLLSFNKDIDVFSLISESTYPDKDELWKFIQYHDVNFILLDFDLTGIRMANYLRKKYNLIVLFLTNGKYNTYNYGAKDISDYTKLKGRKDTEQLIENTLYRYRQTLNEIQKLNYNLLSWI